MGHQTFQSTPGDAPAHSGTNWLSINLSAPGEDSHHIVSRHPTAGFKGSPGPRPFTSRVSKYEVYGSSQGCHTAKETYMPHGITQCYLLPGRGDIPAHRASHQTVHILFLANDRCLRDYDLVVAHC